MPIIGSDDLPLERNWLFAKEQADTLIEAVKGITWNVWFSLRLIQA